MVFEFLVFREKKNIKFWETELDILTETIFTDLEKATFTKYSVLQTFLGFIRVTIKWEIIPKVNQALFDKKNLRA